MADVIYLSFGLDLAVGDINLKNDTFKVMLLDAKYEPDAAKHRRRSDVMAHEIRNGETNSGYVSGGQELKNQSVTVGLDGSVTLKAADIEWKDSTLQARFAVVYKNRGGEAKLDELVSCVDFGSVQTRQEFKIVWDKAGVLGMVMG